MTFFREDGSKYFAHGEGLEPPIYCRDCQGHQVREQSFACDWPFADGKTCDAPLCEYHARQIGEDRHLCAHHYAEWTGDAVDRTPVLFIESRGDNQ